MKSRIFLCLLEYFGYHLDITYYRNYLRIWKLEKKMKHQKLKDIPISVILHSFLFFRASRWWIVHDSVNHRLVFDQYIPDPNIPYCFLIISFIHCILNYSLFFSLIIFVFIFSHEQKEDNQQARYLLFLLFFCKLVNRVILNIDYTCQ